MKDWVSYQYLIDYSSNNLFTKYCQLRPFKHAVLENFFNEKALTKIEQSCFNTTLEPSHKKGVAKDAEWFWGPFCNLEFLNFFYGEEFRSFLNSLLGEELIPKTKHIPQINLFMPNSKGIPIHNDFNENIGVATIIQLSRNHCHGGELIFYEKAEGAEEFVECRKIKPKINTLILFKISEKSYHSVNDMSGDWERRSINVDWYTKEMLVSKKTAEQSIS